MASRVQMGVPLGLSSAERVIFRSRVRGRHSADMVGRPRKLSHLGCDSAKTADKGPHLGESGIPRNRSGLGRGILSAKPEKQSPRLFKSQIMSDFSNFPHLFVKDAKLVL